jgi:hypothetical protein
MARASDSQKMTEPQTRAASSTLLSMTIVEFPLTMAEITGSQSHTLAFRILRQAARGTSLPFAATAMRRRGSIMVS